MLGALLADATSKSGTWPKREAHVEVKSVKALHARNTFRRCNFTCGLGTKHIWKSRSEKPFMLGALLADATSKSGARPKREAHVEVKSVKALHARNTFRRCNFTCGTKHIWKSRSEKLFMLGALLADATSKSGARPKREAHVEVKSVKALHARNTFRRCNFTCGLGTKHIWKSRS